jgi:hypothetical protein
VAGSPGDRGTTKFRDGRLPAFGAMIALKSTGHRRPYGADRPGGRLFFGEDKGIGVRSINRVRLRREKLARIFGVALVAASALAASAAWAQEPIQPPAPLGIFGADLPGEGKVMVSFLPQFSRLQGVKIDDNWVKAPYIVTHVVSAYTPVGSHLLRLVPQNLTTNIQTLSVSYGATRNLTLFASTGFIEKSVNMQAFAGLSGATPLGYKVGATDGATDTTLAAIYRVHHDAINRLNLSLGLSLPTGSTEENISLLLPNGAAPAKRAFYAMQPGSGTADLMPGVTYSGVLNAWSWGLSYRARLPLNRASAGWRYGDLNEVNAWGGYSWVPGLETTFRVNASTQTAIHGSDPLIRGYAQGSNPNFYGGQQVSLFAGIIASGRFVGLRAAQFGLEAGVPVYQNLNGPQLARDWQVNLAFRYKL